MQMFDMVKNVWSTWEAYLSEKNDKTFYAYLQSERDATWQAFSKLASKKITKEAYHTLMLSISIGASNLKNYELYKQF